MRIYIVSVFPEIFQGFLTSSLIGKAQENGLLDIKTINPRDFCLDKHRQVDDEIYGGGSGMLLKAKPFIDAVESIVEEIQEDFRLIYLSPSREIFDQTKAFEFSNYKNLILVCGRYEGIDYRFEKYCREKHPDNYQRVSVGKYVTMGGEVPAMIVIESVSRLIPGVIKEESSWSNESYDPAKEMKNIEYPQYTRPQEVYGMEVPEVLLSGNHEEIRKWREENEEE